MPISLLRRGTLKGQLTAHLTDAILRGDLQPGERIVEGRLARDLMISQGALREALQHLEHQGLVSKVDNWGTFVSDLSTKEIEDIYLVRSYLEPLAAQLACQRLTADDIAELFTFITAMKGSAQERNFPELLKNDLALHRLVWHLSGNRAIERALNAVCPPIFALYLIKVSHGGTYDAMKDVEEHEALVKVLETGDSERAKNVFEKMTSIFRTQDIYNLQSIGGRRAEIENLLTEAEGKRNHRRRPQK